MLSLLWPKRVTEQQKLFYSWKDVGLDVSLCRANQFIYWLISWLTDWSIDWLATRKARYTVVCLYNTVQYNTILHTSVRWLRLNINESWDRQKTPHTSPSRARYGVSFVKILEKIDRVITVPHCSNFPDVPAHTIQTTRCVATDAPFHTVNHVITL